MQIDKHDNNPKADFQLILWGFILVLLACFLLAIKTTLKGNEGSYNPDNLDCAPLSASAAPVEMT